MNRFIRIWKLICICIGLTAIVISCGDFKRNQIKETAKVSEIWGGGGNLFFYRAYSLNVDSVEYIVVCSDHGIAITPKIKNK